MHDTKHFCAIYYYVQVSLDFFIKKTFYKNAPNIPLKNCAKKEKHDKKIKCLHDKKIRYLHDKKIRSLHKPIIYILLSLQGIRIPKCR